MIFRIQTERQRQAAARRIPGYHDLGRLVFLLFQKPSVRVHRILQRRRIRMLRRHPVVRRQNIRAEADLRILNRKPPVNIFHRTDIPAAVQLQNDAPRHRLLRL